VFEWWTQDMARFASIAGWMEISPAALRTLRAELEKRKDRVLDEMGMGTLHKGYANALFPGTSVLHTRPRYLFFVPWIYLDMARRRTNAANARAVKESTERWLTRRLLAQKIVHDEEEEKELGSDFRGIIGARVFPPASRPDFVYWTALREFGMYQGVGRAQLLARWHKQCVVRCADASSSEEDVDTEVLGHFEVPPLPAWWRNDEAEVTFDLTSDEAQFLQRKLMAIDPPCLLGEAAGRLGVHEGPGKGPLWDDDFMRRAASALDASKQSGRVASACDALDRMRGASAMAELVRAMYAAMVEALREKDLRDGGHVSQAEEFTHYRDALRAYWRDEEQTLAEARELSLEGVRGDLDLSENDELLSLLGNVQKELRAVERESQVIERLCGDEMRKRFTWFEQRRKGPRARLPVHDGRVRREGFDDETIPAGGLHYRWGKVRRLLLDLQKGLAA
jgi:hypothetical protein